MCSMRQHFSKPATLQARRFTLAAGRLAPFAYPVASGWPARVIKHGNGKWTICTYKCYIYIYISVCVCRCVILLLKPPFIGDFPLPCLIT